ncbi:4-hydroxy-tetrahydrodipicolinate synthase [Aureicoccus marinus]|uniref:4-hydroxy-tetrahydrodipicolinate synthase n=1 Tax=Aureicoccus marinus TaxID=754435 RepID=A0A2S7T5D3_9FLAO|nr:4-hydroxy-tetrahydrodipicolinate synthase [Aureicoccus marinus]PQJ14864.1 4-hydroxy-tetrahydrodipicolinate synthase [Aureicoccus marinus]
MENTDARGWTGVGVALITPFLDNYNIDDQTLSRLVEHCIDGGLDYLVALGTTGEAVTLNREEKQRVMDIIREANKGRLPLMLGYGGNNTQQMIEELPHFNLEGYSAFLSANPAYNKPTQEGLLAHYGALVEAASLPILLYNVPGRSASNMEASTTAALANRYPSLIGIKEASGNPLQQTKIVRDARDSFLLISGDDISAPATIFAGGKGLISVLGQALPKEVGAMVRAALDGDIEKANRIHRTLLTLIELLFEEGNPAGVKALLQQLGIGGLQVRLPLVPASSDLQERIAAEYQQIKNLL